MGVESPERALGDVQVFEFDQFRADIRSRTLLCDGRPVAITSKVFDTLAFLLRNHGCVVDKDQLMRAIWPDTVVEESNLHHYVSTVRKVLGEKPGEHRFIATVPGRGYLFVAPVRVAAPELRIGALEPRAKSRFRGRYFVFVASVLAVAALLIVAFRSFAHRTQPASRVTRPLTASLGVADMGSFSPDGEEMVFSWRGASEENFHLYRKPIGSESMRQISSGPGDDSRPAWSPDGLRIAFVRHLVGADGADYCLIPARGGPVTMLARGMLYSSKIANIAWTRDGKHLIIQDKGTSSQPSRLHLLSSDGKERRSLTFAVEQYGDVAPAVSPDGKLLAFERSVGTAFELRVMPVLGGESRIVLARDRDVGSSGIAWTPDSRGIVYRSTQGGLWKVSLSDGDSERLGIGSDNAYYPAISASGHLAFTEAIRQVTLVSAALPAPGHAPIAVRELLPSTRTVSDPQWSPDGKQIAFFSDRSGSTDIWRSDAEGGNLLRLTSLGVPTTSPRWSPDGKSVAIDVRSAGNSHVYIISANGGVPRRLTTEPYGDINPAWSIDGKTIYFSSTRSGTDQIWKMPAAGGAASQVTFDGGICPGISVDRYLYFLKAWSTTTLWRMPLDGGKEEVVLDGALRAPRLWAPTTGGVYYIDRHIALRYFDVRSRTASEPLLQFQYPEISVSTTIGASRDGRSVLIPRVRESGTDIMVVERFWSAP
jgi:Tol biopolymer transport system component/DNA-binding winged helix-turn-helix (wHTH) protein